MIFSVIKPESYGILDAVVQVMKDYPQIEVRIEGHTDSDGGDDYNLKLSKARAESVFDYLVSHGISGSRLIYEGYGESRPLAENRTAEGRALNRRVEILIEGKQSARR